MTRINQQPSSDRRELLAERARGMRWMPTPSERLLWAHIRGRRLGVVFRRQVPVIGRYIADFSTAAQRLIVEVDGGYHAKRVLADAKRDAAMQSAGYRVLRLEADLVLRDVQRAVGCIRVALSEPLGPSAACGGLGRRVRP